MVLKITNLHILRYLPTCWLYLLECYTIDNQRCTHTASEDGAAPYAGDAEIALVAGKAGILHLFAGCTSDGCKPLVHLQTGKGGETPCFPAQRKDVADTESRHRTHAQKQTL